MINQSVQQALSKVATEIMRDNVESISLCYITTDGLVHSIFDKTDEGNAFAMVGAQKVITDRMVYAFFECDDDED